MPQAGIPPLHQGRNRLALVPGRPEAAVAEHTQQLEEEVLNNQSYVTYSMILYSSEWLDDTTIWVYDEDFSM
jgi:hypothetical protein